ncbi:MAG TPA: hypothetical protein VEW46_22165 [Pyrinomonadaceae bacterium]|nr:hypothetical protein [Pyrinomonadaceae bacterium]
MPYADSRSERDWARSENRALAAVVASARTDMDPENRFYANALLTITDLNRTWQEATEATIAKLVVNCWTKVAKNERFALKSPTLNAPTILAARADEAATGLANAARVLLVAVDPAFTGCTEFFSGSGLRRDSAPSASWPQP